MTTNRHFLPDRCKYPVVLTGVLYDRWINQLSNFGGIREDGPKPVFEEHQESLDHSFEKQQNFLKSLLFGHILLSQS